MSRLRSIAVNVFLLGSLVAGAGATAPGKAVGTFTFDTMTTTLAFATQGSVENLFDDKKQDTLIVLSDKPLGGTPADDEVGLDLRARKGELVALTLRIDVSNGGKLINVKVSRQGLGGMLILPGQWFEFSTTANGVGTVKMAKRQHEGHTFALSAEFAGAK